MADIHKLIAAISPETYCQKIAEDKETGREFDLHKRLRKMIKNEGYSKDVLKLVNPIKDSPPFDYDSAKADALNLWGLKAPKEEHKILYDSPAEGLEPIYFWLLDFVGNIGYRDIKKITDSFTSSPGSGHFSELQGKATQMQQEASRTMGNVNTVLKSVLNLVYDLKEFKIRLGPYKKYLDEKAAPEDKFKSLLSLKQIWLDNVDIRKGRGSINALSSGELDFVTLRDAFMTVKSLEHANKEPKDGGIDLNERVRKILQQRSEEFFRWITESYNSLKQRFEIERNYLKSQVNMLKLYARWVKPYLIAAQKLAQNSENPSPSLVSAFNTMILELQLFAVSGYDIKEDVNAELVPKLFSKIKTRDYKKVLVIELSFRGIPQRVSQRGDWAFGGKTEIKFTSYALNNEEIGVLEKELEKDDLKSMLSLVQGATDDSLSQIEKDIRALTEDKEESQIENEDKAKKNKKLEIEENKKSYGDDFGLMSFFSFFKSKKDKKEFSVDKDLIPEPDSEYEKVIRSQAIIGARDSCFTVFDTYKKAHGMPSHSNPYDAI